MKTYFTVLAIVGGATLAAVGAHAQPAASVGASDPAAVHPTGTY